MRSLSSLFLFALLFTAATLVSPVFVSAQEPVDDVTIVAFGNSLVEGVGSSDEGFVSTLERWTNLPIMNAGQSGDTTADALDRLDDDVLDRNPDIVIILLGGNDILQDVDREETFDNLDQITTRIQDEGASVILLGAHGEVFRLDHENEFQQLARDTDVAYVPNVLRGILGSPRNLDDAVHPNDRGYEMIAEEVFPELQEVIAERGVTGISGSCAPDNEDVVKNKSVRWHAYAV